MIHVTASENSRNIKYSISPIGDLTVYSLNPKLVSTKEKLTDGSNFSNSIIPTTFKAKEYQNLLACLLPESDKAKQAVNINYVSYPKTVQKPNKFDVDSRRLLSFND